MPTPRKTTTTKPTADDTPADQPAAAPDGDPNLDMWAALTAPFPPDWVEKLPKPVARDGEKGRCNNDRISADGHHCGGWHSRAVHLDYIGHAGITMRLNAVVGPGGWDFQPYAENADGLPLMSQATFAARLTIAGVTKWDMAAQFNGPQEAYGDALRRCAMRFGIGTYLWSKSDAALAFAQSADVPPEPAPQDPAPAPAQGDQEMTYTAKQVQVNETVARLLDPERAQFMDWVKANGIGHPSTLSDRQCANVLEWLEWLVAQRGASTRDPGPAEPSADDQSPN